ncbi:MAG: hypothetical protein HY751_11030 [Nitrospinae bacterium]|nr:hypothetical protein [Nitrospinota bacterium]
MNTAEKLIPLKNATVLANIPFTIDETRVLREMKVPHAKTVAEIEEKPLAAAIKRSIEKAYTLIEGKGVFRTYALSGVGKDMVAGPETGDLFQGLHMVKLLAGCDYATLMAATIGPRLEAEVERLQKAGELTGAFILEMIGGWMGDYMAERVDDRIAREIERAGYGRTMRFSPGYGDWSLNHQPDVLRLSEAARIGIMVTEYNIMIPRKSVSAVIGWKRG